ncbi:bifunctional riboflavin kinase/FAD synthetase [Jiella mangrovi]|uniref:Riboflavin biosynthesis protein n=1 Tax=Jiella mangrovi TaxID=2821407 RepID=A0ABS4BIX0_9HYPH|nr:bifunctional riboflavin kinase/FAD synthetase [Jiella mangrovi]MBP0616703.1 bifunctional riboflavin kinase/FAD synthetase [Jiella mangrovi]
MSAPAAIARLSGERPIPAKFQGGVVAIGNFDGVHRGHQAVLASAREIARAEAKPLICLTFEPHPRTVFNPERPVPRLTPAPIRARLLGALGFDAVVEQGFDRDFAGIEPETFVKAILVERLQAAHVVAGFDFHYGAKRAGTPQTLITSGERHGFGATLVPAIDDGGGETISSSRIRALLEAGDTARAAELLGYRWTIGGSVSEGQRLGRTLGYPTANIHLMPDTMLKFGIYAVRVRRADGTIHDGVASFGRRPTFDNGAALFETFLFDFSGDLYGETIAVSIFEFLRGEEKFDTAEALVAQMDVDSENAKAVLAAAAPLSDLDRAISF